MFRGCWPGHAFVRLDVAKMSHASSCLAQPSICPPACDVQQNRARSITFFHIIYCTLKTHIASKAQILHLKLRVRLYDNSMSSQAFSTTLRYATRFLRTERKYIMITYLASALTSLYLFLNPILSHISASSQNHIV